MKTRRTVLLGLVVVAIVLTQANGKEISTGEPAKPALDTLMRSDLAIDNDVEIIMSRVKVPPHSSLPRHTHPGEEFAYLLEGEVTYFEAGQPDRVVTAGETVKVPVDTVHTISTGDVGATVIVFRVHPKGRPERVLED